MIITAVETLCGSRMHAPAEQWITDRYRCVKADITVVVVHTDTGITGYGEASPYGQPRLISDWVGWLSRSLVGVDVDDHAALPRPTGSGSTHDFAVAGVDCALWDIRGKAAGAPVSRLLAADPDDTVRVYASSGVGYDWRHDPHALVEDVARCAAAGYSLVKVRLGTNWSWDSVTPERFLGLIDEVRTEVGTGVALAVDGNCRLDRDAALLLTRGLSDRGISWFEEPMAKNDVEGYALLNAAADIPISGGESWSTVEQFRPFLDSGAYGIVQPDAGKCGISEVLRIGRLAAQYGVELVPHSWHNGLMMLANSHAVAALPNAPLVEECFVQGPLKWDSLCGESPIHSGSVRIGDVVGLGAEPVADLTTRYPYLEGHYAIDVVR